MRGTGWLPRWLAGLALALAVLLVGLAAPAAQAGVVRPAVAEPLDPKACVDCAARPLAPGDEPGVPRLVIQAGFHESPVDAAFSPDARLLAVRTADGGVTLWDVATGRLLRTLPLRSGSYQGVACPSLAWAPGTSHLLTGGSVVSLWDATTGRELWRAPGARTGVGFDDAGRPVRLARVPCWGRPSNIDWALPGTRTEDLQVLASHPGGGLQAVRAKFAERRGLPDLVVVALQPGGERWSIPQRAFEVHRLAVDAEGRRIASAGWAATLRVWDLAAGRLVAGRRDAGSAAVGEAVAFRGSDEVAIRFGHGAAPEVVAAATLARLRAAAPDDFDEVSPDGRWRAAMEGDRLLVRPAAGGEPVLARAASRLLGFVEGGAALLVGDAEVEVAPLPGGAGPDRKVATLGSPCPGRVVADPGLRWVACEADRDVLVQPLRSGASPVRLSGHASQVTDLRFGAGGTLVSGSADGTVRLWDAAAGKALATLLAVDERDWVVVTPEGRFDGSPAGRAAIHWVLGLEVLELGQLKERYLEPGLLAKVAGHAPEAPRQVPALAALRLQPEVASAEVTPEGLLRVALRERAGGVGRVQVFVNGKELLPDARAGAAQRGGQLEVRLDGAPALASGDNEVRVVAWNAEGTLASRGLVTRWRTRAAPPVAPSLHAVVVGISDYDGPALRLAFAAKDARSFAAALRLGGARLFGEARTHVHLVEGVGRRGLAAKEPLREAFRKVAAVAKPEDLLVVYLAGHGGTLRAGAEGYAFLTEEARDLSLGDPELRTLTAVTGEELAEWTRAIPALKQLLVLDTCAAGAAAATLAQTREVPADQVRAIERLADRTGLFVLMGAAADAPSYEASRYGQGLLTYALLQAMRGAALRDDRYVDVGRLLRYAEDQVPVLAAGIGGVQQPRVATPQGASFDVGALDAADRTRIPLAQVRPVLLRPVLLEEGEDDDVLRLSALVRGQLRELGAASARGDAGPTYLDVDDLPDAVSVGGRYRVEGEVLRIRLTLRRGGARLWRGEVTGPAAAPGQVARAAAEAIFSAAR